MVLLYNYACGAVVQEFPTIASKSYLPILTLDHVSPVLLNSYIANCWSLRFEPSSYAHHYIGYNYPGRFATWCSCGIGCTQGFGTLLRGTCMSLGIYLFGNVYAPGEGPVPLTYSVEALPHLRSHGRHVSRHIHNLTFQFYTLQNMTPSPSTQVGTSSASSPCCSSCLNQRRIAGGITSAV